MTQQTFNIDDWDVSILEAAPFLADVVDDILQFEVEHTD